MNINLLKLFNSIDREIIIDDEIDIPKEYLSSEIKDVSKVKINGNITTDGYIMMLNLNIKCNLTLICSVSLKDVNYPIDIDIEEEISDDADEDFNKIFNNSIDLLPIIWQNILVEIPSKVVSPDVKEENVYGDGWKFITNEEDMEIEINPELSKLKDFLGE